MAEAGVETTAHVASGQVIGTALGGDLALAALSLARRFAAGGTMWCLAPAWPEHARHVAVEFVHPVIVGKRALPAVSVIEPDPVAVLRATVRAGDVILAVGAADAPGVASSLQRAGVWGADVDVDGSWPSPTPRASPTTSSGSRIPCRRRPMTAGWCCSTTCLWELTHVCLEHPGLLAPDSGPAGGTATCVTCSDEGRMAEVVEVQQSGSAVVRTASGPELIDTTIVGTVVAGDLVLIHAGSAIAVLEDAGDA